MQAPVTPQALPTDAARPAPADSPDAVLAEELLFLEAWAKGLIPWAGAMLRVRQIRRASPALAAAACSPARPLQATGNAGAAPAGRSGLLAAECGMATARSDATACSR